MKGHASVIGPHTGLWTMIFGVGALAMLMLACAGTAADVYVDESGWRRAGGAFNASGTPIQAAVDDADAGDTIVTIRHIAERVVAQDLNYYAIGNQINFSKGVKCNLVINDSVGDVAYDFIDIKQGIISVEDTNLTVKIQLANIPHQLLFDKTNVTDWFVEHNWAVYIDIDGNASTGCGSPYAIVGTEYAISCSNFKHPDSLGLAEK